VDYETFEHGADIGVRGFGRTMAEAFENTAIALYSVMVNIPAVEANEQRSVTVSAPDHELLLIEWLNALLSLSDIEHMVFSKFKVKMEGTSLTGTAWGEKLDQERHEPNVEIKGATYYMLKVTEEDGGLSRSAWWMCECEEFGVRSRELGVRSQE
jgi:tRNA nucleotidyltransferase (CCA-adding enzyme)